MTRWVAFTLHRKCSLLIPLQMEVRQRYLFAIEDPFELDHNVARTVAHNGIVAIRDEFRRAWAILCAVGRDQIHGDFLEEMISVAPPPASPNVADKRSTSNNPGSKSTNSVINLPTDTSKSELVAEYTDVDASLGLKDSSPIRDEGLPPDIYDEKSIDEQTQHNVRIDSRRAGFIPTNNDTSSAEMYDNSIIDEHTDHHVVTSLGTEVPFPEP